MTHDATHAADYQPVFVGKVMDELQTVLQRYHDVLREADHWARLDRLLWDGASEAARRMMPYVDGDHRSLAEARALRPPSHVVPIEFPNGRPENHRRRSHRCRR